MIDFKNTCAICGSSDLECKGSTHHSRWYCKNCKKDVEIKRVFGCDGKPTWEITLELTASGDFYIDYYGFPIFTGKSVDYIK